MSYSLTIHLDQMDMYARQPGIEYAHREQVLIRGGTALLIIVGLMPVFVLISSVCNSWTRKTSYTAPGSCVSAPLKFTLKTLH